MIITVFVTFAMPSFSYNAATIAKKRSETKAKIFKLKILENRETDKMYKNQQKLEDNEKDLAASQSRYSVTKDNLLKTENELRAAQSAYAETEYQAKQRIRQIYKKEKIGMFAMVLSADDFNTFLDRMYYQNRIAQNDKVKIATAREKARRISALKARLEQEKVLLASTIDDINSRKARIEDAISSNKAMIKKLQTDRAAYERSERELARQSQIIERMISRNTKSTKVAAPTGGFSRPTPGPITSSFGWRTHPIFKSRIFHSGIDIGAPYGAAIRAANSGKVIYTGWYGGYGKVVIIDHGRIKSQSITTLYAHQSRIAVSNGQNVSKGQVIGYVGSTGYSTGPHCHYEVRINGKPTNPLAY